MHKIKPYTAGTVKSNFKGTVEMFLARDNAFSFMSSVKEISAYWKQFYYLFSDIVMQQIKQPWN